jgi:hypothetical protein
VTAGLGLGWQIIQINDETIVDHSGSDWGVHTHSFSFLNAKKCRAAGQQRKLLPTTDNSTTCASIACASVNFTTRIGNGQRPELQRNMWLDAATLLPHEFLSHHGSAHGS